MPGKNKIEDIREAISKHRGGHANATDQQIMRLWVSLDKETQEKYLTNIKQAKKEKKDAKGS